jgi:hypothetical protein
MKFVAFVLSIACVKAIVIEPFAESMIGDSSWSFGKNRSIESLITELMRNLRRSQSKVTTDYEPKFM